MEPNLIGFPIPDTAHITFHTEIVPYFAWIRDGEVWIGRVRRNPYDTTQVDIDEEVIDTIDIQGDTTYTAKLEIESIRGDGRNDRGLKVPVGVYLYKEDSIAQVRQHLIYQNCFIKSMALWKFYLWHPLLLFRNFKVGGRFSPIY